MSEFYRITKKIASKLIKKSIILSNNIYCDKLDCNISFKRAPTDKTVEDVFKMALKNKGAFWNFVFRDNFGKPYFDVGCRTWEGNIDYFLWIELDVLNGQKLIEEYKLKKIL